MSFRLEQLGPHADIALVRQRKIVANSSGRRGCLLTQTAQGEWAEVSSPNPALNTISAVALTDWGAASGNLFPIGVKEFPPGFLQAWIITGSLPFLAQFVGTLPTSEGGSFGVVKDTDGLWKINFADTANARVKLVDLRTAAQPAKLNRKEVGVIFLPGFAQLG